jgi:hypothetical protein
MAAKSNDAGAPRYFYMVTFEIAPEDEPEFNEIYDTEHVPNLLQVDGVLGIMRFRDAALNDKGWLVYSALYVIARPDLPTTPEWKAKSELGRWAPVMRPRMKARRQRLGSLVYSSLYLPTN